MVKRHAHCRLNHCVRLLVWLMAALGPMAANATTVYRWVDAQGRVHFGDPASAPQHAQPMPVLPGTAMRQSPVQSVVQRESPQANVSDSSCEQARTRYEAYLSAGEIVETDSLGVERALDGAAREQLIAGAEMEVARACEAATGDGR